MSKQNHGNRKTRRHRASAAIGFAAVEATGNPNPIQDAPAASRKTAQPGFDFDAAEKPSSPAKLTGPAGSNRIEFTNLAELGLPAPGETIAAGRSPLAFARRLVATPLRRRNKASAPSLLARVYARFRGIMQRLAKQFLQRRGRIHKLQLLEIQQLGEKRFIAMVRVGKQKFLIGGAATSVALLAEIDSRKTTFVSPCPLDRETA
jgi:hypothetical protein